MAWDDDEPQAADVLAAHEHKVPEAVRPVPISKSVKLVDTDLRDEFAAQFMNAIVPTVHANDDEDLLGYLDPSSEEEYELNNRVERYDMIAEAAYRMADAMLKARAK